MAAARRITAPARTWCRCRRCDAFRDQESYYATLAHEMTHWTRHPTRLDRDFGRQRFGDAGYAMEELVAEIGAAYLCADLGITPETREDHAAYIGSWLKVLRERQARHLHRRQPRRACRRPPARLPGPDPADTSAAHPLPATASDSSHRAQFEQRDAAKGLDR